MSKVDWQKILKQWSDVIVASGEYSSALTADQIARKWAGFPAANESAIADAERRLNLKLPESYRQFLKISNGWWLDGTAGPLRLWSVEEIRPMAEIQPEIAAIWANGPHRRASKSDATDIPNSHYKSVLQISEDNDGRYLLNPLIKPHPDEWQAAFFAPWVPGPECYESFGQLMEARFEAFLAAHPSPGARRTPVRNLARPPANPISDTHLFIEELQKLGFFQFVSDEIKVSMIRDFHDTSKAFVDNKWQLLDGPFASPGAALLDPKSRRVVNLDTARLAHERGGYAIAMVSPLLASAGIEVGPPEEKITKDSYGVQLEGIEHEYFRLRKGRPAVAGGEHEFNAASHVVHETAKLLNKTLKQKGSAFRIAELQEMRFPAEMRLAFVLLDDELSYLFMWSPCIHNYCRAMRPDVFR